MHSFWISLSLVLINNVHKPREMSKIQCKCLCKVVNLYFEQSTITCVLWLNLLISWKPVLYIKEVSTNKKLIQSDRWWVNDQSRKEPQIRTKSWRCNNDMAKMQRVYKRRMKCVLSRSERVQSYFSFIIYFALTHNCSLRVSERSWIWK